MLSLAFFILLLLCQFSSLLTLISTITIASPLNPLPLVSSIGNLSLLTARVISAYIRHSSILRVSLLKNIPLPGSYKINTPQLCTKKTRSGLGSKSSSPVQPLVLLYIVKSVKLESLNYLNMSSTSLMVFFNFSLAIPFFHSVKIQIPAQCHSS